ncbi:hypothetical protein DFQ27_004108 [Actinomortierella ambigua]|uniref:Cytochrome c oxidase assembly protein COX20, mitochondrial n=1 Tax=Actinomortierella ambigua TaxID=1343610 RepID=A0A9P6U4Y3_9FUNG|nr:hypothetical protein DFQ27_004108 [Actinomortierella ambigua]
MATPVSNNPNQEEHPPTPIPVLNDPRPAPDSEDVVKAFKSLSFGRDFSSMKKSPCTKEAFFDGAIFGAGVGMFKAMRSGLGRPAFNWALGGFVLMTVGTWEYCYYMVRQKRQLMSTGQMPVVSTVDMDATRRKEAIAARQREV